MADLPQIPDEAETRARRSALWVYVAMAGAIAATAFVLGQLIAGLGAIFAGGATTLWTAFIVARERKLRSQNS